MKVIITVEDAPDGQVHLNMDFGEEGISDDTRSPAVWLALKMMDRAGEAAKEGDGEEIEDEEEEPYHSMLRTDMDY